MENLKEVIREIIKYRDELNLRNLSDDKILEAGVSIFLSGNVEKEKEQPASDKQKWFLKKIGIKFPSDVSKREAFKLIQENKNDNSDMY